MNSSKPSPRSCRRLRKCCLRSRTSSHLEAARDRGSEVARPPAPDRRIRAARHGPMASWVYAPGVVLHSRWYLGNLTMRLDPSLYSGVATNTGSDVDWHLGERASGNLRGGDGPPASASRNERL